jgi:hypothetical protein
MMVPTLTLAHGGTAGLIFEIAFLAVPVLVFTVMGVMSSRRARREKGEEPEVDP